MKIAQWIDSKIPSNESGKVYAQELKKNLDYSQIREEISLNHEKIIVIPIREHFLESRKAEPGCSGNLVVLIDDKNEPRRINIVLYKPESTNQTSKLPYNTFYHLFNTSRVTVDGKFHFLDVNGIPQYILAYKNKKLVSRGIVVPLSKTEYTSLNNQIHKGISLSKYLINRNENEIQQKRSSEGCILIDHTIIWERFDENTQEWVVFSVFVMTTVYWCPGQNQTPVDDPNTGTSPLDSLNRKIRFIGPTGATWGGAVVYEYAVSKEFVWTAYELPYGYISSTETVYGKKVSGLVSGGYFTSVTHSSSQSTDGTATWVETTWHNVPSFDMLYLYLNGTITNNSGTTNIQEARSYSFAGLFP